MNNLFKKVGFFAFFYVISTNPVFTMGPDKITASDSQEAEEVHFVAYNETSSTSDMTNLSPDFECLYCDEDWVCAICLNTASGENGIITLPCNHKFHKDCIEQLLSCSLEKICPYCRQLHGLRRNIVGMVESAILPLVDTAELDNVSTEFLRQYQDMVKQHVQNLKRAVDCLSNDSVVELNAFLKSMIVNPDPGLKKRSQELLDISVDLGNWKVQGEIITREVIRNKLQPFQASLREGIICNEDARFLDFLFSLLEKEGQQDILDFLRNGLKEKKKFELENMDSVVNFLYEMLVVSLFGQWSSSFEDIFTDLQDIATRERMFCEEIGVTKEEL